MKKTTRDRLIKLGTVSAFVAYAALSLLSDRYKPEPDRNCFYGNKQVECPAIITTVQDSIKCATRNGVVMKNGKKETTGIIQPNKITLNVEPVSDDLMSVEITTREGIKGYVKVTACAQSADSR